MSLGKLALLGGVMSGALIVGTHGARAEILVQCYQTPGNFAAAADKPRSPAVVTVGTDPVTHNPIKCKSLAAGDGFITLADGTPSYIFGFSDVTGKTVDQIGPTGHYNANFAAPTIVMDEGDEFYLTLTNVGFGNRPDLFDPHTVHFHGFPNAMPVFDGEPEGSFGTNVSNSFTFFYHPTQPGTYMYHCHQEAAEHMQMGMLGNLYVRPRQNKTANNFKFPSGFVHKTGYQYVYNDGDGSTRYDVEFPLQIEGFDPTFHDADQGVQPPPFAIMKDAYPMFNGRGYPQTVDPNAESTVGPNDGVTHVSQPVTSNIVISQGQKALLRLSSLDVQRFYTITTPGLVMRVVGRGARIFRGGGDPAGMPMSYLTHSVTLGGGESYDVILDTDGVPKGTYFLYTSNANYLVNGPSNDYGGLMTEIVIN